VRKNGRERVAGAPSPAVSGGDVSVMPIESVGDRLATVRDPQIAELGRRGQAAAALREPVTKDPPSADGEDGDQEDGEELVPSLRLVDSERACVETNLTRRGFWLTVAGGPRQLALPLEEEDRFGLLKFEPARTEPSRSRSSRCSPGCALAGANWGSHVADACRCRSPSLLTTSAGRGVERSFVG
jgi:hypothetical protein